MSHFIVVAVMDEFTEEGLDEMLAPYQENNMGDCPREYMEFYDEEDEYREKYASGTIEAVVYPDGTTKSKYDKEFEKSVPGEMWRTENVYPEEAELKEVPFSEVYDSFEHFIEQWAGYSEKDNLTGKYGYWENPNAKWDWYVVGGRWKGYFDLKDDAHGELGVSGAFGNTAREGRVADVARVGDIDFYSKYEKNYDEKLELAKNLVEKTEHLETYIPWKDVREMFDDIEEARDFHHKQPVKKFIANNREEFEFFWWSMDGEVGQALENPEKFAANYATRSILPYAILDDEGWHSRGEMGWFGVSLNEDDDWDSVAYEKLTSYPEDKVLVAVDCHI